ncbi:hypothetical protein [Pseudoxanthomonas mexicana]
MTTPIDATTTSAWGELAARADGFTPDLRRWFADDPGRVERLTSISPTCGSTSKNWWTTASSPRS